MCFVFLQVITTNVSAQLGSLCVGTSCFLFVVIWFVIAILIAVWVYKDAEQRGSNGALWLIIVILTGIIGIIIWLIARPPIHSKKNDVKCQICGIPKGDKHFYVVNKKDQKLIVCGKCVEPYRNEIAMKNKEIKQTSDDESLNILKTRYAKGEITKEQYEQMKKDLEK